MVSDVGHDRNFKLTNELNNFNFDLFWTDQAVQIDFLSKMKPFQKVNHWPGMGQLSRKNNLARNLTKMQKKYDSYNFFPISWNLPADTVEFRQ